MENKPLILAPLLIDSEIEKIKSTHDKYKFCEQSIQAIRLEKSKLLENMMDDYSTWDLDYLGRIEFAIKYLERKCLLFVNNDLES
jgi:hypothetical protein